MTNKYNNLSEFIQDMKEIRRHDGLAEVIADYYEGDITKPVRIIGFVAYDTLTDFEIYEEAWHYYQELCDTIDMFKNAA